MRHFYGYVPSNKAADIDSDAFDIIPASRRNSRVRKMPLGSLLISTDLRFLVENEEERSQGRFLQRISRIKAESIYGRITLEKMIDYADTHEFEEG